MPLGAVHDFAFYLCAAWLFLAPGIMVSVFSLSKRGGCGTNLLAGALCKINRGACCSHTMWWAACFPLSFARGVVVMMGILGIMGIIGILGMIGNRHNGQ